MRAHLVPVNMVDLCHASGHSCCNRILAISRGMALAYAAYTYLSKLILGMFVEGFESLETESLEEQVGFL